MIRFQIKVNDAYQYSKIMIILSKYFSFRGDRNVQIDYFPYYYVMNMESENFIIISKEIINCVTYQFKDFNSIYHKYMNTPI